jgi:hypothetical protein
METSIFVNDCEPTLHVGVTGKFDEQKYASMMEAHQWNGVSNKGSKSTFITVGSGKDPVCWNFGGDHRLPDFTLPIDQENISEGKKKMQDAMKKARRNAGGGKIGGNRNGATSGKFRKPNNELHLDE